MPESLWCRVLWMQNTIDAIDSETSSRLAQIEAKKQRQSQLKELDTL